MKVSNIKELKILCNFKNLFKGMRSKKNCREGDIGLFSFIILFDEDMEISLLLLQIIEAGSSYFL